MTSHLWITFNKSELQNEKALKPDMWMWDKRNEKVKEVIAQLSESGIDFRESRDKYLEACISTVFQQNVKNKVDYVDQIVQGENQAATEKVCYECGCESDYSYRICRNCGGKVTKISLNRADVSPIVNLDPYQSFTPFDSHSPDITCTVGEPDFVNPNSFHTIIKIIQNIGVRAGVKQYGGQSREWLFVECDGLPYNTMRDIIANVWRCPQCNNCYYGSESFEEHKCFILQEVNPVREFGWLIPVSGLLHVEMNAARSFLKLNWEVFTSTLGFELGFKSPKAQEYLRKGSDHHKTWHFLEIIYTSVALELSVPYARHCLAINIQPSADHYWEWCDKIEDPNYIYLQHMIFTYLHSLMMLRSGIRKCNFGLVHNAKTKISQLFFGRKHPIYQNVFYSDAVDHVLMPEALLNIKQKYVSGSRTGHRERCQGGDALLEEINKESKSWLKMSGIPTEQQWIKVFRNLDELMQVRLFYCDKYILNKYLLNIYYLLSMKYNYIT